MPPSCQLHLPKHPIFKSALLIMTESTNAFYSTNLSFFSCYHVPTKNSSNLDYITTQKPSIPSVIHSANNMQTKSCLIDQG